MLGYYFFSYVIDEPNPANLRLLCKPLRYLDDEEIKMTKDLLDVDYDDHGGDDDEICCKELPALSRTCYGLLNSHTILLFCHIITIALSLSRFRVKLNSRTILLFLPHYYHHTFTF